jgi:hypothetical protein
MRASSNTFRRVWLSSALLCSLVVAAGCGQDTQMSIVLSRHESLDKSPPFVRFHMMNVSDKTVEQFGPYDIKDIPSDGFAQVAAGDSLVIDVFGCPSEKASACEGDKFTARGCSKKQTFKAGEQKTVKIVLYPPGAAAVDGCPDIVIE